MHSARPSKAPRFGRTLLLVGLASSCGRRARRGSPARHGKRHRSLLLRLCARLPPPLSRSGRGLCSCCRRRHSRRFSGRLALNLSPRPQTLFRRLAWTSLCGNFTGRFRHRWQRRMSHLLLLLLRLLLLLLPSPVLLLVAWKQRRQTQHGLAEAHLERRSSRWRRSCDFGHALGSRRRSARLG